MCIHPSIHKSVHPPIRLSVHRHHNYGSRTVFPFQCLLNRNQGYCCCISFTDSSLLLTCFQAWSVSLLGGVSSQRQLRFQRATRSLATFVCSHCSLCSLAPQHFALLRSLCLLTLFTGLLTHFTHSLVGQLNMCLH